MNQEQAKNFIRSELSKILDKDFENRIRYDDGYNQVDMTPLPFNVEVSEIQSESLRYFDVYRNRSWKLVDDEVQALIKKRGLDIPTGSIEYATLRHEYVMGMIELAGSISVRESSGEHNWRASFFDPVGPQPVVQEARTNSLSSVISRYVEEQKTVGAWSEKTVLDTLGPLNTFVELVGDIPIESMSHEVMRGYKDKLLKFPCHHRTIPALAKVPLNKLLERTDIKKLSPRTVVNHIRTIASFFNWAIANGFIEKNFATGLAPRKKKQAHEDRDIFQKEDLEKLFLSPHYLNSKRPAYFYVPLLGLFTGARLEELCQLEVGDIYQEGGVWIMDINESGDKKIKTSNSKRKVPLHPFLVDSLRFPGFVQSVKAAGHTRVFHDLPEIGGRYGKTVSEWFGRYKERVGITGDDKNKKVFHSFRHTLATALDRSGVQEKQISLLLGHVIKGETGGRYIKPQEAGQLYREAILKLDYEIDLSPLLTSKFVAGS